MNREMAEIVRNQQPLTMRPSATVQDACKAMHERRVGAVLITNPNGELVGIFTGRDAVRLLGEGKSPCDTDLHQVMTRDPHCLPTAAQGDRSASADARWWVPPRAGGA
jgi:CBS domain-containing protein